MVPVAVQARPARDSSDMTRPPSSPSSPHQPGLSPLSLSSGPRTSQSWTFKTLAKTRGGGGGGWWYSNTDTQLSPSSGHHHQHCACAERSGSRTVRGGEDSLVLQSLSSSPLSSPTNKDKDKPLYCIVLCAYYCFSLVPQIPAHRVVFSFSSLFPSSLQAKPPQ